MHTSPTTSSWPELALFQDMQQDYDLTCRPLIGSNRRKLKGTSPTLVTSRARGSAAVLKVTGPKFSALAGVMLYLLNTARMLSCSAQQKYVSL